MGEQRVKKENQPQALRAFIRSLLNDLRALRQIIGDGMIESDTRRIGAEQELFLVNPAWRPAPVAMPVLERLSDPHYTNEIALFNLEINLEPLGFAGDCLVEMERQLQSLIARARAAARDSNAEVALAGILPTVRKSDLGLENMTPKPRYSALNDALKHLRGWAYEMKIAGLDELNLRHETWMMEACCTSFQLHFQCGVDEFANLYNLAQAVTAPVLAAAANSPLLFGRRLWRETRIPLFEQSIDTRNASYHLRERHPRVSFGSQWVKQSVLELFEEDLARFRVLLGACEAEDPFAALGQGRVPRLDALRIYNSTVWRWNRACYGITDGKPHLRIEARALPAGPTVADEVANAAFFFGLMSGLSHEVSDVAGALRFEQAKMNFLAAAQLGLEAQFEWFGGDVLPAHELILDRLLPAARAGLQAQQITDGDRYLDIIEARVRSGRTGAQWMLDSFAEMRKHGTRDETVTSLVATMARRQHEGQPVHTWPLADVLEEEVARTSYLTVEEFMTTDLFTVHQDEPLDLVVNLMDWNRVRHVPVEDEQGRLVGLLSVFEVLRRLDENAGQGQAEPVAVSQVMQRQPLVIPPDTPTLAAIALMRRNKVDCLLVVKEGRLIGLLTERDFIHVAARLLEQRAKNPPPPPDAADV
ncbi:MAG TPA: CBS domain-containing protein [Blastocatellia bacterium]|nr:CBS domain-containing protein [Blastocatellia bacterium]